MTPVGMAEKYFAGVRFDFMVTFSSVEHSGLARQVLKACLHDILFFL
jgi:hypothetical protein